MNKFNINMAFHIASPLLWSTIKCPQNKVALKEKCWHHLSQKTCFCFFIVIGFFVLFVLTLNANAYEMRVELSLLLHRWRTHYNPCIFVNLSCMCLTHPRRCGVIYPAYLPHHEENQVSMLLSHTQKKACSIAWIFKEACITLGWFFCTSYFFIPLLLNNTFNNKHLH